MKKYKKYDLKLFHFVLFIMSIRRWISKSSVSISSFLRYILVRIILFLSVPGIVLWYTNYFGSPTISQATSGIGERGKKHGEQHLRAFLF